MDTDALRALQAPLKARYRAEPAAAIVGARAVGQLDVGDVACVVRTWPGETVAGLHPATGGDGARACSADMLLEALVACAGVTLSAVATALAVPIRGGRIVATGTWDARGTLGVDRAAPVGLTDIELAFELDTAVDEAQLDRLLQMTERYCVIFQTLRSPPHLTMRRAGAPVSQ